MSGLWHSGGFCKSNGTLYESILIIKHLWSLEYTERIQAEPGMAET